MHFINPATRGLRTLFELGSDRFWFAFMVILGLFLASWLGELVVSSMIPPVQDGVRY